MSAPTTVAPPPVGVEVSPADRASDVSPTVPLEISVTDGEVTDVSVVDGAGAPLAHGSTYTLTATAEGGAAGPTEAATTSTTVTPRTQLTPAIGPLGGQTVVVGMPIRVYLDVPVTDKAAVERDLRATSSTPTDGVWN